MLSVTLNLYYLKPHRGHATKFIHTNLLANHVTAITNCSLLRPTIHYGHSVEMFALLYCGTM